MPQNATYPDGGAIPAEYIAQSIDRGLAEAVDIDCAAGDVLLIDNIAVAHGRRPITGPRRILVSMSD